MKVSQWKCEHIPNQCCSEWFAYPSDTRQAEQKENNADRYRNKSPFGLQNFGIGILEACGDNLCRQIITQFKYLITDFFFFFIDIEIFSLPIPANWESKPRVISITKNRIDHRGDMGSLERASGYAMKANPKPKTQIAS